MSVSELTEAAGGGVTGSTFESLEVKKTMLTLHLRNEMTARRAKVQIHQRKVLINFPA